jgi:DNA repair protein RecO (recombination protein O)
MILKTEAVVLRIHPFSETSCVVTWLTKDYGKLSTLMKGAYRPKSSFLGQFDLFYTCELLIYFKNYNTLHIVKECSPLKYRRIYRQNWRATACASYFVSLIQQLSVSYARYLQLYHWLNQLLDIVPRENDIQKCMFWHELQLLVITGAQPQLHNCIKCHKPIPKTDSRSSEYLDFSAKEGGIYCSECGNNVPSSSIKLPMDVLGILRFWEQTNLWKIAKRINCTKKQMNIIERLLESMLSYHLDINLAARKIALQTVRVKIKQQFVEA